MIGYDSEIPRNVHWRELQNRYDYDAGMLNILMRFLEQWCPKRGLSKLSWYRIYWICLQKQLASRSRDDEVYPELLNAVKFNDVV
jgi:hypothetical protein